MKQILAQTLAIIYWDLLHVSKGGAGNLNLQQELMGRGWGGQDENLGEV